MIPKIRLVRDPETGKLIQEIWRTINGYEGYYEISNYGRVKSLSRLIIMDSKRKRFQQDRILTHNICNTDYPRVTLTKNGKGIQFHIHCLVANAFIPNPNRLGDVNHKDSDRLNPIVNNLEWTSRRENVTHGWLNRKKASVFPGVQFLKNRGQWKSIIWLNGKGKYLGQFKTEKEASDAYQQAVVDYGVVNKYAKVA